MDSGIASVPISLQPDVVKQKYFALYISKLLIPAPVNLAFQLYLISCFSQNLSNLFLKEFTLSAATTSSDKLFHKFTVLTENVYFFWYHICYELLQVSLSSLLSFCPHLSLDEQIPQDRISGSKSCKPRSCLLYSAWRPRSEDLNTLVSLRKICFYRLGESWLLSTWTFSRSYINPILYGFHTLFAYSKWLLTILLYIIRNEFYTWVFILESYTWSFF